MAQYDNWVGMTALDSTGDKVGTIDGVYLDDEDGSAKWATVKAGLLGSQIHFAPAHDAHETNEGVMLSVTEDKVKNAPMVENDEAISDEEEAALNAYYFARSEAPSDDIERIESENGASADSGLNPSELRTEE